LHILYEEVILITKEKNLGVFYWRIQPIFEVVSWFRLPTKAHDVSVAFGG
jgi:hypothetical protein